MLRINVLGGLFVTNDGRPVSGAAAQPRRLALLALLVVAGDRGVTRDALLAYLWPDTDEERGRRALTQALYALRRDLGSDEAMEGMKDLRLNPDLVGSDLGDFQGALQAGDLNRAVEAWRGPFLEGFHLPGADTFERWVQDQRGALQHDYTDLLDRLARRASADNDPRAAAGWLRKLAATDPLNGRIAARLMRALADQGDVAGALQHARVYETLLQQELELPPDREVVGLAEELRKVAAAPPRPEAPMDGGRTAEALSPRAAAPAVSPEPRPARTDAPSPAPEPTIHETSGWATVTQKPGIAHVPPRETDAGPRLVVRTVGVLVTLLFAASIYYGWRALRGAGEPEAAMARERVVAVGRITHYASGGSGALGEPLADMLATNLARSAGLRVVSNARMVEVVQQLAGMRDSAGSAMAAAREAGATELLDGALYDLAPGQLRLDLRRVDLASGDVLKAYTITGADLFALADSGTERLVRDFGAPVPGGSFSEVSTSSVAAYQAYEAGLRLFFTGDVPGAERRFGEALALDSAFAMAAYYHAQASSTGSQAEVSRRLERAVELAARASDRERLIIEATWAFLNSSPRLAQLAETLTVRYPEELDGYYFLGQGANLAGDYPEALAPFREVIRRDSFGLSERTARCLACQAFPALGYALGAMDSLPRAVTVGEEWTRAQPGRAQSWRYLAVLYVLSGRLAEADRAVAMADSVEPDSPLTRQTLSDIRLLGGRYAEAEQLLRAETESAPAARRREALWDVAVVLRQQGRFRAALATMHRYRREKREPANPGAAPSTALQEAQVLFELGRHREAAALFDSIARYRVIASQDSSASARGRVWAWTHMATALAASGDTARLPRLADTLQLLGRVSGFGRDRRLHAHLRGLLAVARKDDPRAALYFREAILSPNYGYTRSNYELAGVYLRLGRPREAVAILQPALRTGLTGSNLYVTRTELRERLAQAFEAAGERDSAAAHYAAVAETWERADPEWLPRRDAARRKAAELGARP